eukprot:CAMPEP_0185759794 /NCGR_PEP_ID=MMETSP1174-20130828/18591_1 /TAXON_ID=35687 /ORGANISM="Dictyocha speculum, Strain CCMP1381" /LENGTH=140 /DNA_ID=CAMNT_0028440307 /DNA_START=24 /DNA_END=446 /DNA_ORIENTATION=-
MTTLTRILFLFSLTTFETTAFIPRTRMHAIPSPLILQHKRSPPFTRRVQVTASFADLAATSMILADKKMVPATEIYGPIFIFGLLITFSGFLAAFIVSLLVNDENSAELAAQFYDKSMTELEYQPSTKGSKGDYDDGYLD